MISKQNIPCPVCGEIIFYEDDFPGSHDICRNCHWEDDEVQFYDKDYEGGANDLSLNQSIIEYRKKLHEKK